MNLLIMQILFLLLFFIFSLFAFFFFISVFTGAPYVPTPMKKVNFMINLVKIKRGDKIADLGSGDGRLLVEAAKKGAYTYGVEINPGLVIFSWIAILKSGLQSKAKVHWGSLYNLDYSKYDVIFVAGFIEMMKILEKRFEKDLKKGTKVICYAFPLPNQKPKFSKDGVYFYQY